MMTLPVGGLRMSDTDVRVLDEILSARHKELAPDMDDGEFFEFFTAREILRNYSLSPNEIQHGIIGGDGRRSNAGKSQGKELGTDGGIDAFYLLVNGRYIGDTEAAEDLKLLKQNIQVELIIMQASREKGFPMNRLLRLGETSENIFSLGLNSEDFTEQYNEALLDAIQRFRIAHRVLVGKRPTLNVSYFLVTKGRTDKIAPDIERKARGLEDKVKSLLVTVSKPSFTFVGARELIELANKPPMKPRPLRFENAADSPKGGYAVFVKLGKYFEFITDGGEPIDHLFDFNVRDYEGDVEVNKEIRKTLAEQPSHEDFWWRNNGITIVASNVYPGHFRELVIEDPYIVNGLQTSHEIYEYFRDKEDALQTDGRHVLVRVVASGDSATQDAIIRATNSQTGMAPAALWATDPVHRDLETIFPQVGLFYDRRKHYWRNRDIPLAKVVGIQDLAQSIISMVLQEPHLARGKPSRYFKHRNHRLYKQVFAKHFSLDLYLVCAITRKKAEAFLRKAETDARHRNNLLFYVLMVAGCLAANHTNPSPQALAMRLTTMPVDDDLLAEAVGIVRPLYDKLGADDQAAKGPELIKMVKAEMDARFPKKGNGHEENGG